MGPVSRSIDVQQLEGLCHFLIGSLRHTVRLWMVIIRQIQGDVESGTKSLVDPCSELQPSVMFSSKMPQYWKTQTNRISVISSGCWEIGKRYQTTLRNLVYHIKDDGVPLGLSQIGNKSQGQM